jgi:hypothetical protein
VEGGPVPPRSVGVLRAPTPRTDLTRATRASAHVHTRMHARASARKCTRADACTRLSFASNSSCRLTLSRRMSAATCTPCGARRISRRTARADAAQHNGQVKHDVQRNGQRTHARIDRSAERNRQAIGRGRRLRRQLVPLRLVRAAAAPAAPLAWHVAGMPSTTQHNVQWAYNTTLAHVLVTQAHLAQPVLGKLPPALRVVDLLGLTR